MARVVGPALGRRMADLHRRHGTATRFGVGVGGIRGRAGDLEVRLTDGGTLPCATVVVGIGAEPADGWLAGSGLRTDHGVVCDGHGRTAAPGVYALGDVAAWRHPDTGLPRRVEHWTSAVDQARAVAAAITGAARVPYRPSHFVWSDQYDWRLHVVGRPAAGAAVATLAPETAGPAAAPAAGEAFAGLFAAPDGALCGAVVVNWPQASVAARRALAAGAPWRAVPETLGTARTAPVEAGSAP
jgi:NADPH-dependent 2,4-dienoyl-CoA reductase/sulfur reductase-like enzyme